MEIKEFKRAAWMGVDLDGTLAFYDGWKGSEHIGEPIMPMVERVRRWIRKGTRVKIFTARVAQPDFDPKYIHAWLAKLDIQPLEVTNVKDMHMIELWDDRAVRVERNTGKRL